MFCCAPAETLPAQGSVQGHNAQRSLVARFQQRKTAQHVVMSLFRVGAVERLLADVMAAEGHSSQDGHPFARGIHEHHASVLISKLLASSCTRG